MPAIASITINDGATTPVAHVFTPSGIQGSIASYHDRSGGISVGYPAITISSVTPSKNSKTYKVRAKLVLPVLETQSGTASNGFTPAPTKAYDLIADMSFVMPARSSLQNRKDLFALAKNLCAQAVMTSVVQDNEVIY